MASKETIKLQTNIEEQLDRLVQQLKDLESYKDDLDPEEYEETKSDTIEQLKEFQTSLSKLVGGNLTLVDHFTAIQLAIQAAITEVIRTPEVIQMFAKRQPEQLRLKLSQIVRDLKLGKLSPQLAQSQQVEILSALKGLGEHLEPGEEEMLEKVNSVPMKQFIKLSDNKDLQGKLLALAEQCFEQGKTT